MKTGVMCSVCTYRCIMDDTVEVYPSDPRTYDFGIHAFKFTGGYTEVLENHILMV